MRVLVKALEEVVNDWKPIGLNLDMQYHELEAIEGSHGKVFDRFLWMLHNGLCKKSKTVKSLRLVLEEIHLYCSSQLLDRLNSSE